MSGNLGQQLTSSRTVFDEIRLLHPLERAILIPGEPPTLLIETATQAFPEAYSEALTLALEEMVGRLRTLLHWELPLGSDITGGRDSRVVLAALQRANDTGRPLGEVVDFTSHEHWVKDWAVVTRLDRRYRMQVNSVRPGRGLQIDPWVGLALWRRHDLGVYSPVYSLRSFPLRVSLGGAGGGGHRMETTHHSMADRLRAAASPLQSAEEIDQLITEMEDSLRALPGHPDPRVEHFRRFRERFHGGRQALRSLQVPLLTSAGLRHASGLLPAEHVERAQFFADLMFSLAPDLAAEPYDVPSKGWDHIHRREATRVRLTRARLHGRVHGQLQTPPVLRFAGQQPLDPYRDLLRAAAPVAVDSGILTVDYVTLAFRALDASNGRVFAHATHAIPLSHTLLVAEVLRLTGAPE